jgi:hypothetical protein
MAPRVSKEIEAAILCAAEEVRYSIAVEVNSRGTDIVPFDVFRCKASGILEHPPAVEFAGLAEEIGIGGVEEEIELPIAVPVGDTEFAASAGTALPVIEAKRGALFVNEGPARGFQDQPPIDLCAFEKSEIAFLVEHGEIRETVFVKVEDNGSGAPLG